MPKICYVKKRFQESTLEIIEEVNRIIDDFIADGFILSIRQIYYQFITHDLLPEDWIDEEYNRKKGLEKNTKNTIKNYKRLGSIISDGRLAGEIDWSAIEDRDRQIECWNHYDSPQGFINSFVGSYAIDLWEGQPERPEVWIEKKALEQIISKVCGRYDVTYFACKGYVSQSEMWTTAQRFVQMINEDQEPVIIHLGDHDPSGIDMTRDIFDRLELMVGRRIHIERIALNMDQIKKYNPPPNPAKLTDTRAKQYIDIYGDNSWELDALNPRTMNSLVEKTIKKYMNKKMFKAAEEKEERDRDYLNRIPENWGQITEILDEN